MKDCETPENISFCVPEILLCREDTCLQYEEGSCEHDVFRCAEDEFLCHVNEMCISQIHVCDGILDCENEEDELFCKGEQRHSLCCQEWQ